MNPEETANDRPVDRLAQWQAPERAAASLQPIVANIMRGPLGDALRGRWLGHGLHPMMTDIPIGAYTVAAAADIATIAGRDTTQAASVAIDIGLVGSLAAIVTGWAEWSDTQGSSRRLGLVHAWLNGIGFLGYGLSRALRKANRPASGRVIGLAAYGCVGVAAYLGGELAYGRNLGMRHTAISNDVPRDFTRIIDVASVPLDTITAAEAFGIPLLLLRTAQAVYATSAVCTHRGAPLAPTDAEGTCVTCPWHGSQFDVRDGTVLGGPATFALARFEARVESDGIEIRALGD